MGEWQKCNDAVYWTDGEIRVTLKLAKSERQQQDGKEQQKQVELHLQTTTDICLKDLCREHGVEIADVTVPEWRELLVWVKNFDGTPIRRDRLRRDRPVWFGEQPADQIDDGLWRFTFRNYLGKSVIRIQFADGREVTTDPIEVVSPKTPLELDEQARPHSFTRSFCAP